MAVETSLPTLLTTLSQSLTSALESASDKSVVVPPTDGISLLDVKNDLFLSYLQNLVFLIILKIRNRNGVSDDDGNDGLDEAVVKKLVEMRVYLEKGVKPLEGRLKYQIDKVLRAADDATRAAVTSVKATKKINGNVKAGDDGDLDASDQDSGDGSADGDDGDASVDIDELDDQQYRPNPASGLRTAPVEVETKHREASDGIYRPPRITATAMPTTTGPKVKEDRRANKSATLEEFVNTELSAAPMAEPSIGSTIVSGGRRSKSDRERKEEQERKEYEEKNYVRLPKESKKDRAKKGGRRDAGYGGEEWRGLGEGIDRIDRLTKRKGGETRSVLEKSRKRPTEDGPRASGGAEAGQGFQKRMKTLDGGRRDRGKK